MEDRHKTGDVVSILRRENPTPLLVTAALADSACLLIVHDVAVPGIQFGLLSCLALWLAAWQPAFILGGGMVLANALAAVVAEIRPALHIPATISVVFLVAVVVDVGTRFQSREEMLLFYGIQAAILLTWMNATRAMRHPPLRAGEMRVVLDKDLDGRLAELVEEGRFASRGHFLQEAAWEKLERLDESRLARECAKLNPAKEKELAEERLSADAKTWPQC